MGIIEGNIVSAPLNTRDVGSVLGSASNDVGTLCTHANINMWAKFKPVPLRAMFPEDTLEGSSDWSGNPQSSTHKPWWYGDGDQPAYTANLPLELTADNFSHFGVDMPDREQGELDFEPLDEEAFGKLVASNDWTLGQIAAIEEFII